MSKVTQNPPQFKTSYSYDEANQTISVYDATGVKTITGITRHHLTCFILKNGEEGKDFTIEKRHYRSFSGDGFPFSAPKLLCELEDWIERYANYMFTPPTIK